MKGTLVLVTVVAMSGCNVLAPYIAAAEDGRVPDAQADTRPDAERDMRRPDAVLEGSLSDVAVQSDTNGSRPDAVVVCPEAGQVLCETRCVVATNCAGCVAAKLYCAPSRACVSNCASCNDALGTPLPIECFACDTGQNKPTGSCRYNDPTRFCLNGDYSTAHESSAGEHCDCSDTQVSNCLGAHHVCKPAGDTDWCITCGELGLDTQGLPCKGGGTCNTSLSPPRCE